MPAGCALSCFSHFQITHELLEAFASGYNCKDDSGAMLEGLLNMEGGSPVNFTGLLQRSCGRMSWES